MKHLFFFGMAVILLTSCSNGAGSGEQAAAVDTTKTKTFYGAEFDIAGAIDATVIPAKMETADSLDAVISGKIVETCGHAGCWMTIDIGQAEPVWVFTGHEFFVPTEGCAGLPTHIKGVVRKEIQSVEDQKHLAEDAKKSPEEIAAITAPKSVYSIDATGIMIEGYVATEGEGHEGHDHDHDHNHEGHDHSEGEATEEGTKN